VHSFGQWKVQHQLICPTNTNKSAAIFSIANNDKNAIISGSATGHFTREFFKTSKRQ